MGDRLSFVDDIGAIARHREPDVVEEEFEITIPDDQAEKIKTVGEAVDYIQREIEKK